MELRVLVLSMILNTFTSYVMFQDFGYRRIEDVEFRVLGLMVQSLWISRFK